MNLKDRELLAKTLQAEAGNQGNVGMVAVGSVIMNRLAGGNDLSKVILQPGQFSAWNSLTGYAGGEQGQNMDFTPNSKAYEVADYLLSGNYEDPTGGATHYYNPQLADPNWGASRGGDWQTIGQHVFGKANKAGSNSIPKNGPLTESLESVIFGGASAMDNQVKPQPSVLGVQTQPPPPPQPRQGLLGGQGIGSALGMSEDFIDRLKIAVLSGSDPRGFAGQISSIQEGMQGRKAEAKASDRRNKTAEVLRQRGQGKIADLLEQGLISGSDAGQYLMAVPKEKGKVVDASVLRKMFPGAQIEEGLYNLKPDGTSSKVGGGGVNVSNVVGGEGAEAFEKEFGKLDAQAIADVAAVGSSASRSLMQIDRLETLLNNVPTGMSANIKQLAGNFGIQTEGLGDIQAATAIINALVPAQRPAGSGPMSDADLDLFKQSLPRIINSPGGNQMIIDTMRGLAQYDAMGSEIVQRFRAKEISKVDAFKLLNSRPDPFASFKASVGPVETDMSTEDALKILNQ